MLLTECPVVFLGLTSNCLATLGMHRPKNAILDISSLHMALNSFMGSWVLCKHESQGTGVADLFIRGQICLQ